MTRDGIPTTITEWLADGTPPEIAEWLKEFPGYEHGSGLYDAWWAGARAIVERLIRADCIPADRADAARKMVADRLDYDTRPGD